jgi:hypothetical protein
MLGVQMMNEDRIAALLYGTSWPYSVYIFNRFLLGVMLLTARVLIPKNKAYKVYPQQQEFLQNLHTFLRNRKMFEPKRNSLHSYPASLHGLMRQLPGKSVHQQM